MTRAGHPDRLLAAHALELAVLQDAQQLRLRRFVQVADFVEKDGAAVGQLELAAPERRRTGERALLVAEQLALDQLGRNRGAVHLHERTRGKRALAVDVGREQLLAGPDSPDSSTLTSDRATCVACCTACRNTGADPIIFGASPTSSR